MVVLHCKTMPAGARANVTTGFWQLISSMFISRKWEYEPIRQFKLSVLLCILCKCNCRRNSSHCKSATQFAPQKCVSLITEKFPKEEGGQWPTSVTHFAKMTYLRPPTRLFHSPSLRRLGLWRDRSKHPWGRDVEQSSPRPDWIQNRQAQPGGRSQKLPPEAEQILGRNGIYFTWVAASYRGEARGLWINASPRERSLVIIIIMIIIIMIIMILLLLLIIIIIMIIIIIK